MSKTILITGSTDGIGKLVATKLAREGNTIYVHGRNPKKLSSTVAEIKKVSKNENVQGFVADFSDLDAVKKMGQQITKNVSKIDVLINNAGIFKSAASTTKDGFDIRFSVNYFAPYLLTNALLPLLKKGSEPRIINLSSAAQAPISYEALAGNTQLSDQVVYAQSKLALTIWSFYLAKKESGIQVIAVNPGSLLNTKMVKEAYGQHWAPAEKGENILYDLAISKEYKNVTGKYFDNDKGSDIGTFAPAHSDAYDETEVYKLIEQTEGILN
ncbi:MAG: SDR family NAD(P)-dependent oxidoreductase [Muriicola sp.]|nr:SDR family NAD(P)-dependent oxidoreductase [Muriicola sp.]NNK10219.1 SDR family NAD(P)-dependent oxidoreductase [Flavobacteriaceae bacterium]